METLTNLKKRLSVELNKAIEPLLKEYYGLFKIKNTKEYIVCFYDSVDDSDIFFGIIKENYDTTSGHTIDYGAKPFTSNINTGGGTTVKLDQFLKDLRRWFDNLKYYQEKSLLDDPVLRGYFDEFYRDFKIIDEDADSKSFTYDQQLKLTEFLENVIHNIDIIKDETNGELIDELKSDAAALETIVTKETKNGFMKNFSSFLAKARKGSIKASNFIIKEFVKDFLKEGVKWLFNFAVNNAHQIPDYISHLTQ